MDNGNRQPKRVGGGLPESREYFDAVRNQVRFYRLLDEPVYLTWWLLVLNVAIWFAGFVYGNTLGIETARMRNEQLALFTGMKVNRLVAEGQWWRLLSSQFVHLNFMHILFNGYGLYILGPLLERFYGRREFFALYLSTGVVSALASFWFTGGPSGGASGAIYGLVGVVIIMGWRYREALPQQVSRALTTGFLPWVVLGIGVGFLENVPMDNAAHLGGLLSGMAMGLVVPSRLGKNGTNDSGSHPLVWLVVGVGALVLVYTLDQWAYEVVECTASRATYLECYPEVASQLEKGG